MGNENSVDNGYNSQERLRYVNAYPRSSVAMPIQPVYVQPYPGSSYYSVAYRKYTTLTDLV